MRDHQPEPEERDDSNNIGSDDAIREYIDNASAASMAKEEHIQEMAEDAQRKDMQFEAMLARLDAKDKQMNDLILQVAAMNSNKSSNEVADATPQGPRAPKRKAGETDASRGTANASKGAGSGENGAMIPAKYTRYGEDRWTQHRKFNFPIAKDAPFNALEISWDNSWPADKKAYYTARKQAKQAYDTNRQQRQTRRS